MAAQPNSNDMVEVDLSELLFLAEVHIALIFCRCALFILLPLAVIAPNNPLLRECLYFLQDGLTNYLDKVKDLTDE